MQGRAVNRPVFSLNYFNSAVQYFNFFQMKKMRLSSHRQACGFYAAIYNPQFYIYSASQKRLEDGVNNFQCLLRHASLQQVIIFIFFADMVVFIVFQKLLLLKIFFVFLEANIIQGMIDYCKRNENTFQKPTIGMRAVTLMPIIQGRTGTCQVMIQGKPLVSILNRHP